MAMLPSVPPLTPARPDEILLPAQPWFIAADAVPRARSPTSCRCRGVAAGAEARFPRAGAALLVHPGAALGRRRRRLVRRPADGRRRRDAVRPARARLRGARLRRRILPPPRAALSAVAAGGAGRGAARAAARRSCCWCASSAARRCRAGPTWCRRSSARCCGRWSRCCCNAAAAVALARRTADADRAMARRLLFTRAGAATATRRAASARPSCATPSASCSCSSAAWASPASLVLVAFGALFGALRLPAGRPARALPDARRGQPHRDRADRAQPRRDHRPQRRRAGAELFGLHARDHAVAREEPRRDDRRARRGRRRAAARPQALPQAARGVEELREPADPHAAHRRGGRALRRQPLPLPRRRDQGAPVPPVSVRRGRLARRRLHRPHQRPATSSASTSGTRRPTTRAPTTSARSASSCRYERELHGTTGVEQVEVDAGGRAVRTLSRTPPIAGNNLTLSLDIKLQQVAEDGVRRPPRRAGRDRPANRRRAGVRLQARLRSRTCSSTASTRRTGRSSTTRPTSRCSTGRCAAPIRRARRSSRSWRSAR